MSHWLHWLISTYLFGPVPVPADQGDNAPLAEIEEGTDTEDFFGEWVEMEGWETWVPKIPSLCWRIEPWCPEGIAHLINRRSHRSQRRRQRRRNQRNKLFGGAPPELTNYPEISREEASEEPPSAPDAPLSQLHCPSCHCHSFIIPAVTDPTYVITSQPNHTRRTMCVNPLPPQSDAPGPGPGPGPVLDPGPGPVPDPGPGLTNLM